VGNQSCLEFVQKNLPPDCVTEGSVLEAGSRVENVSIRPMLESLGPASYVGVDIVGGPGVDRICDAEDLVSVFGRESFDLVVSTELLEHVLHWQKVISNFKNILKPGGMVIIATRSKGFDYHGYPYDFWRYEIADMKKIFSEFRILALEQDPEAPGVFLIAQKPSEFEEADLSHHKIYSVVSRRRIQAVTAIELLMVRTVMPVFICVKKTLRKLLPERTRRFLRRRILSRFP
jgi:SAM-dependent methyltransferase